VTSLAVLLVCLAVSGPVIGGQDWLALTLIPLCTFCGAPFWTLLLRHGIGGMVPRWPLRAGYWRCVRSWPCNWA